MLTTRSYITINTNNGPMRCLKISPVTDNCVPALIFYSEIFQITEPIERSATFMAGQGFIVLIPEVFHELNPAGTVLSYDDLGKDKGNQDKWSKPLEAHDDDCAKMVDYLANLEGCNGKIGSMGVCIGGHLAFRAALNANIQAAFCLYPTDIHSNTLPCQPNNDSLTRSVDINAEVFLIFGKQDPHIPSDGRQQLYQHFNKINLNYHWLEVNAQHAFMRDGGDRFDAQLALDMYSQARQFFNRILT